MHIPKAFAEDKENAQQALVEQHPLATLCVQRSEQLVINHVPLLWVGNELHGHIARNNELVDLLQNPCTSTAVFTGPEGYISPSDYPAKTEHGKVVPTWNYAVVHVEGQLHLRDDSRWVRAQIDRLTAQQENRRVNKCADRATASAANSACEIWTLDDAPADFGAKLIKHIVGIELQIESVTAKFKLSQNRPMTDRIGARDGVTARGNPDLGELMRTQE